MRTTIKAVAVGMVAAGVAVVAPGGTALADPGGQPFTLTCAGQTYDVTTPPGHGDFTPAFDLNGTRVFIPVSFGAFTGTITGPAGFTDTFTDPETAVKGSGKQGNTTECTYRFVDTSTLTAAEAAAEGLPGPGTYTFVGTGTVTGQIRGH